MRSNTITLSINPGSIKFVTGRFTSRLAVMGNVLRSVLSLTFMRERLGYLPEPMGSHLKCHSPRSGNRYFEQSSDAFVRWQWPLRIAITATRVVPLAAPSVRLEAVRAERFRQAATR